MPTSILTLPFSEKEQMLLVTEICQLMPGSFDRFCILRFPVLKFLATPLPMGFHNLLNWAFGLGNGGVLAIAVCIMILRNWKKRSKMLILI